MSARLRPAPVVIRAWFLFVGLVLLLCAASMFDVTIEPIAPNDSPGVASLWIR